MNRHILATVRSMLPGNMGRPLPHTSSWDHAYSAVRVTGLTNEEGLAFRNAHKQFQVIGVPTIDDEPLVILVALKGQAAPFDNACNHCGCEEFDCEEHNKFRGRLRGDHVERFSGKTDYYMVLQCVECKKWRML